jgi:hypothetical protein
MTDKRVEGTIDNGATAMIELQGYTGRAGIRPRGDAIEVAYFGQAPRKIQGTKILVDRRAMVVTERNDGASPGFVVLMVVDDPEVDS